MDIRTNFRYENEYIKMFKGDTLAFGFIIEGVDDLDAVYFSCKKNTTDIGYLFQKTLGNGISKNEDGYTVRISPADTMNAEAGNYFYDLRIVKDNDVYTILSGVLELDEDVTKGV